jgi:hypothetical protein
MANYELRGFTGPNGKIIRDPQEGDRATFNGAPVVLEEAAATADRPTEDLTVGRRVFDTDLGHPIWWNGTAWVDATGSTV